MNGFEEEEHIKRQIRAAQKVHVPTRTLENGKQLWLYTMMYTWRLAIGEQEAIGYDDYWCYDRQDVALRQFVIWEPTKTKEPEGWTKHKPSGRCRPDGDASKEFTVNT